MGLPDSSQPITRVIVGVMMAIRFGSSCEREQSTRNAYKRAIAGIGFRLF